MADTTSATGSEKNAASAVNSAGRKISPARKINFRKAEQKSASFTLPRAVVSSTSGYCTAERDDHKGKPLNIGDGTVQNLRIFCEEPYIDRRYCPGHDSHQNTEGNTQSGDVQNRFFDSLCITFSIIEADYRLASQGDAAHRHGDEQKITLYNGCTGDQCITFTGGRRNAAAQCSER